MSELKPIKIMMAQPDAVGTIHKTPCEVYPKDEADKVIAELKKQVHDYAQGLYVMRAKGEKELRHQKYKRCLAMAKWCEIGAQFQHNIVMQFDNPFYIKRAEWLEKWHNRWLELAEKFKEAK